jgi:hypothetical protein
MWGGGGQQDAAIPPTSQEAELFPKSADLCRITSSHQVAEVPEDATGRKKAPTVRQIAAKCAPRESRDQ